jgi:transposase
MPIMPGVELTDADRSALAAALHATKTVRDWRRLQAIHLLASGQEAPAVAAALGCHVASVYGWADVWRTHGLAGLTPRPHGGGRPRRLETHAEADLERLLGEEPQGHGYASSDWTVPLLKTALEQQGQLVSERTLRRVLHRLGWRWNRPKYLLGRPDPAYAAKKGRWSSK